MFGYLAADGKRLSAGEQARYRLFYCGLCRALAARCGITGRLTLTYDLTFLALLLSSLNETDAALKASRCAARRFARVEYASSPVLDYAADINVLLAYYQLRDHWRDDKNPAALLASKALAKAYALAAAYRPRQAAAVSNYLLRLGRMEAANELNPDLPSNLFGEMTAAMFTGCAEAVRLGIPDQAKEWLGQAGAALGRFLYLLDAREDLSEDLKRKRYNPLLAYPRADTDALLRLHIGECADAFEQLPLRRDKPLLQNILYAGVWQNCRRPPVLS